MLKAEECFNQVLTLETHRFPNELKGTREAMIKSTTETSAWHTEGSLSTCNSVSPVTFQS